MPLVKALELLLNRRAEIDLLFTKMTITTGEPEC